MVRNQNYNNNDSYFANSKSDNNKRSSWNNRATTITKPPRVTSTTKPTTTQTTTTRSRITTTATTVSDNNIKESFLTNLRAPSRSHSISQTRAIDHSLYFSENCVPSTKSVLKLIQLRMLPFLVTLLYNDY
jgi:hypothetical protein